MELIKLNFSKKKSLSPIISVILLILVATIIAGFLLSFLKNSTHEKLNVAHTALKQASSLDCAQAEIYVDSCLADTTTKDINLLLQNNSDVTLYGLSLSVDGNSPSGDVRLVGSFDNVIKPGEYANLSTGSSNFTIDKETNLSTLDVSSIKNLTISNLACPNKSIFLDTCKTNMCNNDSVCDAGENETYCSNDCPSGCNLNNVCDAENGETSLTCPADCICNYDNICNTSVGETVENCSNDCPAGCNNNGSCDIGNGETIDNCSSDCPHLSAFVLSPLFDSNYLVNTNISFDSNITGGTGNYTCSWNSNLSGVISNNCNDTNSDLGIGNHIVTLNVNDGVETKIINEPINIYNPLVSTILTPTNGGKYYPDNNISFSSSISGGDGDYTCSWKANSSSFSNSCDDFNYSFSNANTYDINFQVTDGVGYTDSDLISIDVFNNTSAPTFSPNGGDYIGTVEVSISTTTPGATIRYTTDDSTPTTTHGTIYSGSFVLTSPCETTVKAVAYAPGYYTSYVSEATFIVTTPVYNVGDTGPAGGKIFYKKSSPSNGWQYLEVKNTDESRAYLGCNHTLIGGTSTSLGTGLENTNNYYTGCGESGAIAECYNLVYGGYDDWFLGSKDEMVQLQISGQHDFSNHYMTSSETSADDVWHVHLHYSNNINDWPKADLYYVVCMRRF